jgi:hypothetical protein
MTTRSTLFNCAVAASTALLSASPASADESETFLPQTVISSTIPGNGDLNPYGIVFVPRSFPSGGAIHPGDLLVSNFNGSGNLQGTGRTIIRYTPGNAVTPAVPAGMNGNAHTFFTSEKAAGLTTALGVLQLGFVVVGNVPTTDGTINTISNGSLQIIDHHGKRLAQLTDADVFDSPWDLTIFDQGDHALLFVSNVLSGTVSRLDLAVSSSSVTVQHKHVIARGYKHEPNASALVLGPTGLAYDAQSDVLYIASTDDNAIFAVAHAATTTSPVSKGAVAFDDPQHLRGPLGLAFAPNGHLVTANGDAVNTDPTHPSGIVEFTKDGQFVREYNLDAAVDAGFGIATVLDTGATFNFAAVNDNNNSVAVHGLPLE